jgi:hypothetical protein
MADIFTHAGKQVLRNGIHYADASSTEAAAEIVQALAGCPLQSFDRAQAIGEHLHDRFEAMTGRQSPFPVDDLAWPDIVQFVVRKARDPQPIERRVVDEVAPEGVRAQYNEGCV